MGDLWSMTLIVPPDVGQQALTESGEVCQDFPLHVSRRNGYSVRKYL